jgi:hypothetical protein
LLPAVRAAAEAAEAAEAGALVVAVQQVEQRLVRVEVARLAGGEGAVVVRRRYRCERWDGGYFQPIRLKCALLLTPRTLRFGCSGPAIQHLLARLGLPPTVLLVCLVR